MIVVRNKIQGQNFCVVSCLRITVFKSPRIMSTPESGTYFKFRNLLNLNIELALLRACYF